MPPNIFRPFMAPYCLSPSSGCNGTSNPLPNANANLGADLDAWLGQYAAKYFQTIHGALQSCSLLGLQWNEQPTAQRQRQFRRGPRRMAWSVCRQIFSDHSWRPTVLLPPRVAMERATHCPTPTPI